MASGKSLELAQITRAAPDPLCICGELWSTHLRKDGQLLARVSKKLEDHALAGDPGRFTRRQYRAMAKARRNS